MDSIAYSRLWFLSQSGTPITGALAVIDGLPPSVKDSTFGDGCFGVQLNMTATDDSEVQVVLQFMPQGHQIFSCESVLSGQSITDADPGWVFQDDITPNRRVTDGFLISIFGSIAMLWPRVAGKFEGSPVYHILPFDKTLKSVALDIVGVGDGSAATFAPGTGISVELKLEGITDPVYQGVYYQDYTPTIPTFPPNTVLNTIEDSNLTETFLTANPADGFFTLVYMA